MALTESQKVALRRIMTNAPGSPNRAFVSQALQDGMSERAIMNMLRGEYKTPKTKAPKAISRTTMDESYSPPARKATSKPTSGMMADIKRAFSLDNDILKYMRENTPGDALMQLAEKAKGPKLKRKPSAVVQAEKAVKEKATPTSGAAKKKTKAPKADAPKKKTWKDVTSVSAAQKAGLDYFMGRDGKKKLAITKEQLDKKGMTLTEYANSLRNKKSSTTKMNKGGYANCGASVPATQKSSRTK